ncbi:MAG: DUF4159 domain-containing protein [Lentisphaerae bacterium]|nr:DUF4159 domain-containing protein [Lentisphaerota bacterium]
MNAQKFSMTGLICALAGFSAVYCLAQSERWNATPNDINNLLKSLQGLADVNYTMNVKTIDEVNTDPEQNPILYYSGHYNYSFSPAQRQKLRKYMLDGGMMVFNTGLGSAPFYRSTIRELETIFPEVPVQRLSSDHPIFSSYHNVDRVEYSPGVYKTGYRGNEPWIDGVTINCRTVAIVSRFCLAVAWDGGEILPEYAAYMPDSAQKLGMNIIAYATANRAWAKNSAGKMEFVDKEKFSTGKMAMVQVMYDGEWKTRDAGLSVLLQTFNAKTTIPVKFGLKEMKLSDPEIFNAPLLYMTGHENFRLKKAEIDNFVKYIENGGFMFAEACCGRKGFDLSFRQLVRQAFRAPMVTIPLDSFIFAQPNQLASIGVTPQLSAQLGQSSIRPLLEGVEVNGHYAIIYSKYGMAGGWEMSQSPFALGYDETGSMKLGQNILMYAITQ